MNDFITIAVGHTLPVRQICTTKQTVNSLYRAGRVADATACMGQGLGQLGKPFVA